MPVNKAGTSRRCGRDIITATLSTHNRIRSHKGTVASGPVQSAGVRTISILHPQGRIGVEVCVEGEGNDARIQRAALIRTARKILQGQLTLPPYVFSAN